MTEPAGARGRPIPRRNRSLPSNMESEMHRPGEGEEAGSAQNTSSLSFSLFSPTLRVTSLRVPSPVLTLFQMCLTIKRTFAEYLIEAFQPLLINRAYLD